MSDRETLAEAARCPECGEELEYYDNGTTYKRTIGVEYTYPSKERYDGVSEYMCPFCKYREGRWTGKPLDDDEIESRFGARGVVKRT